MKKFFKNESGVVPLIFALSLAVFFIFGTVIIAGDGHNRAVAQGGPLTPRR